MKRGVLVLVLAVSSVLLLGASPPALAAARFALVVGNNLGHAGDEPLRWAEDDARRVASLLRELGGVAQGRALVLIDANAGRVRLEIARLRGQLEEARHNGLRTELFVFYSGHGDAQSLHLGASTLRLSDLAAELRALPADVVVTIVDACRGRGRAKGASHAPPFDIRLSRDVGPAGRVMITSAGDQEIAQESDHLRASFFTHHLLSGLRGAADRDRDGRVTLAEVYAYAYSRTLTSSHGATAAVQHPEMKVALEGEGELVMATLARASGRLILPATLGGDFLVVNDRTGQVIAEVSKPTGEKLTLALPAGRFRVQLRRGGRVFAGEAPLEWGGERTLHESMLSERALAVALRKGSSLDPWPWSLAAGVLVGHPTALGESVAGGLSVALERRAPDSPWVASAALHLARAAATNVAWHYEHLELRAGAGLGLARYLGQARLLLSLEGGGLVLLELADRTEASSAPGVETSAQSVAVGPWLGASLSARLPLGARWGLSSTVAGQTAWLPISGDTENRLGVRAGLLLDRVF